MDLAVVVLHRTRHRQSTICERRDFVHLKTCTGPIDWRVSRMRFIARPSTRSWMKSLIYTTIAT